MSSEAALWRSAPPAAAGSVTRAGLAGIAVRPIDGLAVGALVPSILLAPARGKCRTLRLLFSYMARGAAVKKCTWSGWYSWGQRPVQAVRET